MISTDQSSYIPIIRWTVTSKSALPKIDLAGPILAKNAKISCLDQFCCQNWSSRTNFGSENWFAA